MNDGLIVVILSSDETHWFLWGLVAYSSLLSLDDLDSILVFCGRLVPLLGGEVNICTSFDVQWGLAGHGDSGNPVSIMKHNLMVENSSVAQATRGSGLLVEQKTASCR
jgi:hypothetical protein